MTFATYSKGVKSIDMLEKALGIPVVMAKSRAVNDADITGYIGWGRKVSGDRARVAAGENSKPLILLEDGFLGYWGHPSGKSIRLSVNVDHQGIYYDAQHPSQLESMLSNGHQLSRNHNQRIRSLIHSIRTNHLSKYNHSVPYELPELIKSKTDIAQEVVLVIDQTLGDKSISCGLAGSKEFSRMLRAAIDENPKALVIVKTHPDVVSGTKKSAIGSVVESENVCWMADSIHPHALIQIANKVYVVTSQIGFEALMFEKPVVCFGVPFYAGWGLTDDRGIIPERRKMNISIEKLAYDSLIRYPVYVHPDTKCKSEPEEIVTWLIQQKRSTKEKHKVLAAIDFSYWKKGWIAHYLSDLAHQIKFVPLKKVESLPDDVPIVVWGARKAIKVRKKCPNKQIFTMEDGFVRSAGLGIDLNKPSSLMVDESGIYYDCTRPSDLETILNTLSMTQRQQQEARLLISQLNSLQTTKYNVGGSLDKDLKLWIESQKNDNKEVILVPGQVESDASIEFGSPKFKTNRELLQQVRQDFPDASVIYKPHPDQVSKNKEAQVNEVQLADRVVNGVNIVKLYDQVDRVCVLTSLSGFEALIRNVSVSVYGLPFYAGWGLTEDYLEINRRKTKLSLESLVYGALVQYPRYVNWDSFTFCSVNHVMELLAGHSQVTTGSNYFSRLMKKLRNIFL